MSAHQALLSLGFSRQEHWSGLPFPSPMHESEKWKWSHSVVSDLRDPMDCSLPGSSVHGIFQARVLEWVAIAFSKSFVYVLNFHLFPYFCDFSFYFYFFLLLDIPLYNFRNIFNLVFLYIVRVSGEIVFLLTFTLPSLLEIVKISNQDDLIASILAFLV